MLLYKKDSTPFLLNSHHLIICLLFLLNMRHAFFSAFKSLDFSLWLNNKNSYHRCCSFPNSMKPLPEFPSGIAHVYEQIVMKLPRQMWQN